MRVTAETITVLPDREGRDIVLVMAGHRIVLGQEEARMLAEGLGRALDNYERIGIPARAKAPADGAAIAARVAEQVFSWAQIAEAVAPKK